jgi:hypothetical protein
MGRISGVAGAAYVQTSTRSGQTALQLIKHETGTEEPVNATEAGLLPSTSDSTFGEAMRDVEVTMRGYLPSPQLSLCFVGYEASTDTVRIIANRGPDP